MGHHLHHASAAAALASSRAQVRADGVCPARCQHVSWSSESWDTERCSWPDLAVCWGSLRTGEIRGLNFRGTESCKCQPTEWCFIYGLVLKLRFIIYNRALSYISVDFRNFIFSLSRAFQNVYSRFSNLTVMTNPLFHQRLSNQSLHFDVFLCCI